VDVGASTSTYHGGPAPNYYEHRCEHRGTLVLGGEQLDALALDYYLLLYICSMYVCMYTYIRMYRARARERERERERERDVCT
jgi:hypothetical protein